jgi:8-oxo-dGTP diphosphatase
MNFLARCQSVPAEHDVNQERSPNVIVAAVMMIDGRVLACERSAPPETAGRWEFPGGKVEPGESEEAALARECVEELGVRVEVGARVGVDVPIAGGRAVLRAFAVRLLDGVMPRPLEHAALRWLGDDELDSVPWLPADRPIVAELPVLLGKRPA